MNLIPAVSYRNLAAAAAASFSLLSIPGMLRAEEHKEHREFHPAAHAEHIEHRVFDNHILDHRVLASKVFHNDHIVAKHPIEVVHGPVRHVEVVNRHLHVRPHWIARYCNGYRGWGYYYGPANVTFFADGADCEYFAAQADVPAEYLVSGPEVTESATSPVVAVQAALTNRGYFNGAVDGDFGPVTADAISHFQSDNGLPVTGNIDPTLLQALGIN